MGLAEICLGNKHTGEILFQGCKMIHNRSACQTHSSRSEEQTGFASTFVDFLMNPDCISMAVLLACIMEIILSFQHNELDIGGNKL